VRRVLLAGGIAGPEVLETAGGTAMLLSLLGRRGSRAGKLLHQLLRLALAARLDRRLIAVALRAERAALERLGVSPKLMQARLLESLRTGSRRDLRGALADARLVAQPWDIDPGEIHHEVVVLHGAADQVVPPTHAHWYAAHLPRASLEMVPGELHISLCFRIAGHIQHAVRELTPPAPLPEGDAAALAEIGAGAAG
jgi:pimeloyl-ACP methyl ester carboxylesterase